MATDEKSIQSFLFDLGLYLKEAALEAKADLASKQKGTADYDFAAGRALAYYEVLSTLKQTLNGFDIPSSAMQRDDLNPDRDLL